MENRGRLLASSPQNQGNPNPQSWSPNYPSAFPANSNYVLPVWGSEPSNFIATDNSAKMTQGKRIGACYSVTAIISCILAIISNYTAWSYYCYNGFHLLENVSKCDELEFFCINSCKNARTLRNAGEAMFGLGFAACVLSVFCVIIVLFLARRSMSKCNEYFIRIATALAVALWVVGWIVYMLGVGDVESANYRVGVVLGGIVAFVLMCACLLGQIAVSKMKASQQ